MPSCRARQLNERPNLEHAASEGKAAVLSRLAHKLETQVMIPTGTGDLYATLYWQDGYIEAEVSLPGHLETYSRKVEIRATLPATLAMAIVGRPLGDVVALPFSLPAVIEAVEERSGGWLRFNIRGSYLLVDCATGRIWPEPEDSAARR